MWHGTEPFAAGERLTVAFDVARPRNEAPRPRRPRSGARPAPPRRPRRRPRGHRGRADGEPDVPAFAFAGLLAAQSGDPAARSPFPPRARSAPDDMATRINLATALLSTGALDEAGALCAAGGGDPRLQRLAAYVHQQQGRLGRGGGGL